MVNQIIRDNQKFPHYIVGKSSISTPVLRANGFTVIPCPPRLILGERSGSPRVSAVAPASHHIGLGSKKSKKKIVRLLASKRYIKLTDKCDTMIFVSSSISGLPHFETNLYRFLGGKTARPTTVVQWKPGSFDGCWMLLLPVTVVSQVNHISSSKRHQRQLWSRGQKMLIPCR